MHIQRLQVERDKMHQEYILGISVMYTLPRFEMLKDVFSSTISHQGFTMSVLFQPSLLGEFVHFASFIIGVFYCIKQLFPMV